MYPKRRKNKYAPVALTVAAALVVVAGIFFGVSTFSHRVPADSQSVINKVARLMLLPDETPTIAVVSNLGKLQGQAFFAHAHQGDVVLMYPKAQKAVLYSPVSQCNLNCTHCISRPTRAKLLANECDCRLIETRAGKIRCGLARDPDTFDGGS